MIGPEETENLINDVGKWIKEPGKYYAEVDKKSGKLSIVNGSLQIFTGAKKIAERKRLSPEIIASTMMKKGVYFEGLITKLEQEITPEAAHGDGLEKIKEYVQAARLQKITELINTGNYDGALAVFEKLTPEMKVKLMAPDSPLDTLLKDKLFGNRVQGFAVQDTKQIETLARFFSFDVASPVLNLVVRGKFSPSEKMFFLLPFYEKNPKVIADREMCKYLAESMTSETITDDEKDQLLCRVGVMNLNVIEVLCQNSAGTMNQVFSHMRRAHFDLMQSWMEQVINKKLLNAFSLLVRNCPNCLIMKVKYKDQEISIFDYVILTDNELRKKMLQETPVSHLLTHAEDSAWVDLRTAQDNKHESSDSISKEIWDKISEGYVKQCLQIEKDAALSENGSPFAAWKEELAAPNEQNMGKGYIVDKLKKCVLASYQFYISPYRAPIYTEKFQQEIYLLKDPEKIIEKFKSGINQLITNPKRNLPKLPE
jgi:hypothetical protein